MHCMLCLYQMKDLGTLIYGLKVRTVVAPVGCICWKGRPLGDGKALHFIWVDYTDVCLCKSHRTVPFRLSTAARWKSWVWSYPHVNCYLALTCIPRNFWRGWGEEGVQLELWCLEPARWCWGWGSCLLILVLTVRILDLEEVVALHKALYDLALLLPTSASLSAPQTPAICGSQNYNRVHPCCL